MALQSLSTVVRPCVSAPIATEWIFATCKRHQSSFRRTRKMLKVKPHESFLPTKTETQDHIIFNPPASMPSVYHTPSKFLPPDDPRRIATQAILTTSTQSGPGALSQQDRIARLPKSIDKEKPEASLVTPEQMEQIKRLRLDNPKYWTRVRLAEKFNCSAYFISLCAKSKEAGKAHNEQLAAIKARWGKKKTEAREDRAERQKLWGRD